MNPFKDNEVVFLEDKVGGRQGTVKRVYDCEEDGDKPDDPNINGKKLEYFPSRSFNKSWRATIMEMLGKSSAVKANMIFPESAYDSETKSHPDTGRPMKYLVIEEDEYGRAPHAEQIGENRDRRIKEMESEKEGLRRQLGRKEVRHKAEKDESRRKGENPPTSSSSDSENPADKIKKIIGKGGN